MMCSSLMSSAGRTRLRRGRRPAAGRRRYFRIFRLCDLQCANVSDDGPAILNWNLRGVRRHRAPAVGDGVEEVADGRLAQAIVVEVSSLAETATDDHAVAVSRQ